MLTIVMGFKTPSRHEDPKILYAGHSGSKAAEVIKACKLPRIERLDGVTPRTVRTYSPSAAPALESVPPEK